MTGRRCRRRPAAGFTLIELMVVVAVTGVILTLAAPSFYDYLLTQRLRGVHAQVVTDLQFARSEAVARNSVMRIHFRANDDVTCYTIYTSVFNSRRCDCRLGAGAACTLGGTVEVKTESVPRSRRVTVGPAAGQPAAFGFDPVTGGLVSIPQDFPSSPLDGAAVLARIDDARALQTALNRAGRSTVCAPAGSALAEPSC